MEFRIADTLLTTFSEHLANALHRKLRLLIGKQPRLAERLDSYLEDRSFSELVKMAEASGGKPLADFFQEA